MHVMPVLFKIAYQFYLNIYDQLMVIENIAQLDQPPKIISPQYAFI